MLPCPVSSKSGRQLGPGDPQEPACSFPRPVPCRSLWVHSPFHTKCPASVLGEDIPVGGLVPPEPLPEGRALTVDPVALCDPEEHSEWPPWLSSLARAGSVLESSCWGDVPACLSPRLSIPHVSVAEISICSCRHAWSSPGCPSQPMQSRKFQKLLEPNDPSLHSPLCGSRCRLCPSCMSAGSQLR